MGFTMSTWKNVTALEFGSVACLCFKTYHCLTNREAWSSTLELWSWELLHQVLGLKFHVLNLVAYLLDNDFSTTTLCIVLKNIETGSLDYQKFKTRNSMEVGINNKHFLTHYWPPYLFFITITPIKRWSAGWMLWLSLVEYLATAELNI